MSKLVRATFSFDYYTEESVLAEMNDLDSMTDEEKLDFFRDQFAQDIIDYSQDDWSGFLENIDVEFVEEHVQEA